jgi:hypothetical protein
MQSEVHLSSNSSISSAILLVIFLIYNEIKLKYLFLFITSCYEVQIMIVEEDVYLVTNPSNNRRLIFPGKIYFELEIF